MATQELRRRRVPGSSEHFPWPGTAKRPVRHFDSSDGSDDAGSLRTSAAASGSDHASGDERGAESPTTPVHAVPPGLRHTTGGTFELDPAVNWNEASSAFVPRWIPFTRLFRDPAVEREYKRYRAYQGKKTAAALLASAGCTIGAATMLLPPSEIIEPQIVSLITYTAFFHILAAIVEYLACVRPTPRTVEADHTLATRHRWMQRVAWLVPPQIVVTLRRLSPNPDCFTVAPPFSDPHYQCVRGFRSLYALAGVSSAVMVRDPEWGVGGLVLQTLTELLVLARSDLTSVDVAFRFALAGPFALMVGFHGALWDRSDRIGFAKQIMLRNSRAELLSQRRTLQAVVEAAIPEPLLKRLVQLQPNPSGTLPLHDLGAAASNALVVATSAVGFGVFATSKLLNRTVASLHTLFSFFDAALEAFGMEHGAVHGDTYVATAGLLRGLARGASARDRAIAVLSFACWQVHSRLPVDCELHATVTCGALTGCVAGSSRLRYVAAGPAMLRALEVLPTVPAGDVWVHESVVQRCAPSSDSPGSLFTFGTTEPGGTWQRVECPQLCSVTPEPSESAAEGSERASDEDLVSPGDDFPAADVHLGSDPAPDQTSEVTQRDDVQQQQLPAAPATPGTTPLPDVQFGLGVDEHMLGAAGSSPGGDAVVATNGDPSMPPEWRSAPPRIHRPQDALAALAAALSIASERVAAASPWASKPQNGASDTVADALVRASRVELAEERTLRSISRVSWRTGLFEEPADEAAYRLYRERRFDTLLGTLLAAHAIVWITLLVVAGAERLASPEVSYNDSALLDVFAFGALLVAGGVDGVSAFRHLRKVKFGRRSTPSGRAPLPERDPLVRRNDVQLLQRIGFATAVLGSLGLCALRRSVVTNHIEYLQMTLVGGTAAATSTERWQRSICILLLLAAFELAPVFVHQAHYPWPVLVLQLQLAVWAGVTAGFTERVRAGIGLTLELHLRAIRGNSEVLAAFVDRLVPAGNVAAALAALSEATEERTRIGWRVASAERRFSFLLRRPLPVRFCEPIADFVCMEVRLRAPASGAAPPIAGANSSWGVANGFATPGASGTSDGQRLGGPAKRRASVASSSSDRGDRVWSSAHTSPQELVQQWSQLESIIDNASGKHLHLISTLGDTFAVGGPFVRADAAERFAAEACVRLLTSLMALQPHAGFTAVAVVEEAMAALIGEARLRYRVYGVAPLHCSALADEAAAVQQHLHQRPVRVAFVSRRFAGQAGALVGQLSQPHVVPAPHAGPNGLQATHYLAPACLTPLAPQRWRVQTTGVTMVFPLVFAQPLAAAGFA